MKDKECHILFNNKSIHGISLT